MVKADGDVHRKRLFESVHTKMILWIYERLQSVKDNVMGLKKADDAVTDTDDEAANELANCFQRMFTKDDGVDQGNHHNETPKVSEWHNSTPKFSIPDVTAKLQRLNSDKSAGMLNFGVELCHSDTFILCICSCRAAVHDIHQFVRVG